jgi:hydrogenase/urease accessory protein HupE
MKHPRLRYVLLAGLIAAPALAHAHPGHDGDHDFVWDFGHLVSHPFATLACAAVITGAGLLVWRLLKSPKAEGAKSASTDRR